MPITLVTGATAGFGAAIARRLVSDGHRVIATGRRGDRLDQLHHELGPALLPLPHDVREPLPPIPDDWTHIDGLVNNAGLALGHHPAQARADLADWQTMIDTNCHGLVAITHALLPGMVSRNRGHIINIGSIAAHYPYKGGNVYGATKAFVAQFSKNLRTDLLGTPIRVTNIEPGAAETEFSVVRYHGEKQRADAVYQGYDPLTAADIAGIVSWVMKQPSHVNINHIEVMPTMQAAGGVAVSR